MEDLFPGYFRKSPAQIKSIWKQCIFAFDANVLLNLYRYSPSTANSFVSVLKKLRERLWLPWQAAIEFHENRLGVIEKQTRAYDSTSDASSKLLKILENPREHPFIEAELLARVEGTLSELNSFLGAKRDERRKLLHEDPRLRELASLFKDRVGKEPEAKTREKWIESAKARCDRKIPPGFRDTAKEGTRPFGDALMWFELMEHAKNSKTPMVFVTDDTKNDWWLEMSGQIIGPLPALVQEFVQTTGQPMLLYRPDRFAEHASSHLDSKLEPGVVDEIRSQTEERMRRRRRREVVFDSEPAAFLGDLCHHLWVHRDEARLLVSAINRISQEHWRSQKSPFDLPLEARKDIEAPIMSCRCLRHILTSLHNTTYPGYQDALAAIEPHFEKEQLELLALCRQLPDSSIEFVRTITRDAPNKHP